MYADAWLQELLRSSSDPRRFVARRMPAAERAAVVDALRRRARSTLVRALQQAGLWQGAVLGRRRYGLGERSVAITTALTTLQGDDEAQLFRANALLAARRHRAAGEEFLALAAATRHATIRGFARLGFAIASSYVDGGRDAPALCRRLIDSPVPGVPEGGALSLLVQSVRRRQAAGTRLALDRCLELKGGAGLETAARLLTNYTVGPDAIGPEDLEATLGAAGGPGDEVRARWKELLSCC